MAIKTLVNRYRGEPYTGMFAGEPYEIRTTLAVPDYVAYHLRDHSVVKDNPVNPAANVYRLGIEGEDDCSLIDELPMEALDRSDMDTFTKVQYLQRRGQPLPPQARAVSAGAGSKERD